MSEPRGNHVQEFLYRSFFHVLIFLLPFSFPSFYSSPNLSFLVLVFPSISLFNTFQVSVSSRPEHLFQSFENQSFRTKKTKLKKKKNRFDPNFQIYNLQIFQYAVVVQCAKYCFCMIFKTNVLNNFTYFRELEKQ